MAEIAVNSVRENLKQLLDSKMFMILTGRDRIEALYNDLGLLRSFLQDLGQKLHEHEEVKNFERRIRDVVYATESAIDLIVWCAIFKELEKIRFMYSSSGRKMMMVDKIGLDFDSSLGVDLVKQEIDAINKAVTEIHEKQIYNARALEVGNLPKADVADWEEDAMVGFDEEVRIILEELVGGRKQREVISIVGMAGLGKTTLARRVYNDPLVKYRFCIRGWAYVSQQLRKKDFWLCLLSSFGQDTNEIHQKSENELAQMLYKSLKGKLYFVVIDDKWDSKAWIDLVNYFPNDNNGSRILFKSREKDVALHANPRKSPLFLRFLTPKESWDLLRRKVFRKEETCPPDLVEIGQQIAQKCQGLPLTIVVTAGILASKGKSRDYWNQVGETMNSWRVGDPELWMKTLALSHYHLPHHLKPCFLYFGAFPEDFQVPVSRLTWLWVAQGFISETGGKCLEDVAEEYLMDLIGRSLVLVFRRGFDGAIKACGTHDLVRQFCRRKAEEDCFLMNVPRRHFDPSSSTSQQFLQGTRHLSIHVSNFSSCHLIPSSVNVRCILSWGIGLFSSDIGFLSPGFNLIKVLEISSIEFIDFPGYAIGNLLLLKYLAISFIFCSQGKFLDSISDLLNLETLILQSNGFELILLREILV